MRFLFPILCCAALFAAGCNRDAAPDPASTKKPAAPAQAADYDEHSYAEPDKVAITDLALDLAIDFDAKTLAGTATYTLEWKAPLPIA